MKATGFYSCDDGYVCGSSYATEFCVLYEAPVSLCHPKNITRSWLVIYF
jgi:hypothetical protein